MTSKKNLEHSTDSFLLIEKYKGSTAVVFFMISLCLHLLLFAALLYLPGFKRDKPLPPVIQIDLVSFSPVPLLDDAKPQTPDPDEIPDEIKENKEGIPVKSKTVVKKKTVIRHKKPDISLKTKPKNLSKLVAEKKKKPPRPKEKIREKEKPPPKKKEDPEKVLAQDREKKENKIRDEEQARIAQALNRLKQKVASQQTSGGQGKGDMPVRGKRGSRPIDIYNQVIKYSIEQHWVFNDILAKMDKNLEVTILMKILKSGEIRDIIYETRSGNKYLDESAKKAIMKSNPLPALPAGMRSYDLGVIFTPAGLK